MIMIPNLEEVQRTIRKHLDGTQFIVPIEIGSRIAAIRAPASDVPDLRYHAVGMHVRDLGSR